MLSDYGEEWLVIVRIKGLEMNENIYETPQSFVASTAEAGSARIYSPNQVFGGSFWGGPIAAVYFLWKNYIALGKLEEARNCLLYGSIFVFVAMVGMPFVPESVPNLVIPLAYSFSAKQLALSTQLDKKQIAESEIYSFQSSWKVFGIGTMTLLISLAFLVLVVLGMERVGIISLF